MKNGIMFGVAVFRELISAANSNSVGSEGDTGISASNKYMIAGVATIRFV